MPDARSVLEAENKKLAKQVEKLRAQLEAAQTRFEENETALRVLSRIETDEAPAGDDKASSQDQVFKVLPTKESSALAPRQIHHWLEEANAGISADNVRTILLRLKKRPDVKVTEEGRYWRIPPNPAPQPAAQDDEEADEFAVVRRPQPAAFDTDLDDEDVPF
jgi:hypothetical protein